MSREEFSSLAGRGRACPSMPVPPERELSERELSGHPRFDAAMRASAGSAVDLYQGNRLLNALATDRARFILSILCVYLHEAGEPGEPHAGLTPTRAKAACSQLGLCSPGRTAAMLALMQWGGYLAAEPAPAGDRRLRRLVPTRRLMDGHQRRWVGQLSAASMVLPKLQAVLPRIEKPGFTAAFAIAQSRMLLSGIRVIDTVPQLELFTDRDCGLLILFAIFLGAGEASAGQDVAISLTALAKRFGVSRAHVDRLLDDAQGAGLVRYRRKPAMTVTFEPELAEAMRSFFARLFRLNAQCAFSALTALDVGPLVRSEAG